MDWQKESLGINVDDSIIWRDVAMKADDGTMLVSPGMKGKVISLRDGFRMDVEEVSVPPKAIVHFESGMRFMVDGRVKCHLKTLSPEFHRLWVPGIVGIAPRTSQVADMQPQKNSRFTHGGALPLKGVKEPVCRRASGGLCSVLP